MSSVSGFMGQVNAEHAPPSVGRDIFLALTRREISFQEYLVSTGVWIADTLHWYQPRLVPRMNETAARYVAERIMGRAGYVPERARLLSAWFGVALRVWDENAADLRTLAWAKEKCETVSLPDQSKRIQSKIDQFGETAFPAEDFERASRVLRMDADERQRGER
jgi:hypothetical protein